MAFALGYEDAPYVGKPGPGSINPDQGLAQAVTESGAFAAGRAGDPLSGGRRPAGKVQAA